MKWQNHIGLDIGSSVIKLVQLAPLAEGKYRVVALGVVAAPAFVAGVQWDAVRAQAIKQLVKETKANVKQVVISLPESQVYTRVVEMPYLEEPELSSAITWQAEQYIPVPLSDVVLKHQVLALPDQGTPGAKMKVLLLAAPSTVLSGYLTTCSLAGLDVLAVETEVLAVIRSLDVFEYQTLLIHIGAETTTFCIYCQGVLSLTQTVATGSMAITRAISSGLGLDFAQAEQYKQTYGLDESKLDGKVASAAQPIIDFIINEARRTVTAFESRGGNDPVKRLVLSGGGTVLPGLVAYLVDKVNFEVQLANPFYNIVVDDQQKSAIGSLGPALSVGVGLALKPV